MTRISKTDILYLAQASSSERSNLGLSRFLSSLDLKRKYC